MCWRTLRSIYRIEKGVKTLTDKYLHFYDSERIKSPAIQTMILSHQIGGVAYELSKRLNVSPARALDLFYRSQTCADLHNRNTGLYLYGNLYIADEFMLECQAKQ